jgi:hypothetical protein
MYNNIGRMLIGEHGYGSGSVCYVSMYPPSVLTTLPSIFTSFIMAKYDSATSPGCPGRPWADTVDPDRPKIQCQVANHAMMAASVRSHDTPVRHRFF